MRMSPHILSTIPPKTILKYMLILFILYQIITLLKIIYSFIHKNFLLTEQNLIERYGRNTWICIVGCNEQGKQFALQFAKRGFNIFLIGNDHIQNIEEVINEYYPDVKTKYIIKDFNEAYKLDFFDDIKDIIDIIDVSILINNIDPITSWIPYHEMPKEQIRNTIISCTMIQSRMIQLVIPHFLNKKRYRSSSIINLTSFHFYSNLGLNSNIISIPYLSVYEGSKAFTFFHSNSIYREYKNDIDILNITPGVVITEQNQFLKDALFSIDAKTHVSNIIKMVGNVTGNHSAYWGHDVLSLILNIFPNAKERLLDDYGKYMAEHLNQT